MTQQRPLPNEDERGWEIWLQDRQRTWRDFHRHSPLSWLGCGYFLLILTESTGFPGPAAAAAAKLLQSCPTLCDPIDSSPPGSPVPGILQAGTLEWVAISFSNAWKWKVKVRLRSHVRVLATPWTAAHQAPPSMGFSRQEYWSGVPWPSPSFLGQCSQLELTPSPRSSQRFKLTAVPVIKVYSFWTWGWPDGLSYVHHWHRTVAYAWKMPTRAVSHEEAWQKQSELCHAERRKPFRTGCWSEIETFF